MSAPLEPTDLSHPPAPRVSVVVPSYNHAEFVGATLRSIFRQTLAPAEVLVIDDGSTDNSVHVIDQSLQDCHLRCELIEQANRGLTATLNEGLARTKGEYFAYLGSDDLWLPEFLTERVRLLESRERAVLAYGHAYLIDEANRIIDCTADWAAYSDGDVRPMLLQTVAPMSPTVVYRRAALEPDAWNEEAKLEDYDLYLRLAARGEFAFDARVLAAWRRHESNASWDQAFMLDEQLKAQRQAAGTLGLSESELAKLQTATKFSRAEDFLRVGEKGQALTLMSQNLAGMRSATALGRMLLRLLIPFSFVEERNRRASLAAYRRYGSIEI